MDRWAPHLFTHRAHEAGLVESDIAEYAEYYGKAHNLGIAPVLSLGHLAMSSDVEYRYLRSRCERRPFVFVNGRKIIPYRTFAIRKRAGGKRVISVPAADLLRVQTWINRNVLAHCPTHHRAFAYRTGKSIKDCAMIHLGCRWLVKLDLSSFFESITERQVYRVFEQLGYPRLVSFELARLCTRIDKTSKRYKIGPKWESSRREVGVPEYEHSIVGHLPQGAPTSPRLSNAVAMKLDQELENFATARSWEYSRYSDDMYFSSGHSDTDKAASIDIVQQVSRIITKHDFIINGAKTVVSGPNHRKQVLGILVDGQKLRLSRTFRRRLEWHYRHCVIDPVQHADTKEFDSVLGLSNHLNGLLAYARSIDPHYVSRLEEHTIKWP